MTTPDGKDFDVNALEFVESDISFDDPIIPAVAEDAINAAATGEVPDYVPADKRDFFTRIMNEKSKPRSGRAKEPKPVPPKPRVGQLVKPLTDLYTTIGTMMVPFDQPCGMAIIQNAEPCAKALEQLARENPAVRRALLALVETSIWGQVLAAHAPIMISIAMHHVPAIRNSMESMTRMQPDPAMNGHME